MWKLKSTFLDNQCIKKEITREMEKTKMNENENIT